MRRAIVVGVGGVAAAGLGIGLFSIPSRGPAPRSDAFTLVGVRPQEVRSLEVRSDAGQVLVRRDGTGAWSPGEAAPAASATLTYESQAVLFPLQAYRRLQIDAGSSEVGLTKPQYEVDITETSGRRSQLEIGRANFIGAGFYARLSGDPQVYLVARGTVDVLRSVVTGQRFETPRSAKETALLNEAPDDSDPSGPWQRQAVGAGK
jgi:hypothetical protein